jgi:GAF domain-containing protein
MQLTRNILSRKQQGSISDGTVFQEVCKDVAIDLNVDLVSIWLCGDPDRKSYIECQCRYDAKNETFEKGEIVWKADCPVYFETMIEDNIIAAKDVSKHPATRDMMEIYFEPKGICSLLDFILHKDFKPTGVICCEMRGTPREWTEKEIGYLRAIAALVSHRFCDS